MNVVYPYIILVLFNLSTVFYCSQGLPTPSSKEPACQCRRHKGRRLDPWVRKNTWRKKWQLQYPCLGNPMDRRAWRGTVHRVAKSWTRLKWLSVHIQTLHVFCWIYPSVLQGWDAWYIILISIQYLLPVYWSWSREELLTLSQSCWLQLLCFPTLRSCWGRGVGGLPSHSQGLRLLHQELGGGLCCAHWGAPWRQARTLTHLQWRPWGGRACRVGSRALTHLQGRPWGGREGRVGALTLTHLQGRPGENASTERAPRPSHTSSEGPREDASAEWAPWPSHTSREGPGEDARAEWAPWPQAGAWAHTQLFVFTHFHGGCCCIFYLFQVGRIGSRSCPHPPGMGLSSFG